MRITRTTQIIDIIAPIIYVSEKLPKHSLQLKNVLAVISHSCCLLRITDELMIIRASISTHHLPTENLSYSIQLEL